MSQLTDVFDDAKPISVCKDYLLEGYGGSMLTMPCGILNAILTNLGAALLCKLAEKIKFHSYNQQNYFQLIAIFAMSYYNSGLLVMIRFSNKSILPCILTPKWLVFYGKMIKTSMITSNLMPYVGPIIKSCCRRGCFCCKRGNTKTHMNEEFPMVRRYAFILKTVYICFTYGFAIPMLFMVAFIVLTI
jgi:hypothetical protein